MDRREPWGIEKVAYMRLTKGRRLGKQEETCRKRGGICSQVMQNYLRFEDLSWHLMVKWFRLEIFERGVISVYSASPMSLFTSTTLGQARSYFDLGVGGFSGGCQRRKRDAKHRTPI